ncbi:MAG: hypothetical protein FWE20_00340 [Defluviitaleaceae bacterium]|nr:hypothetical protein [Defluviitaleaceae bacterium]
MNAKRTVLKDILSNITVFSVIFSLYIFVAPRVEAASLLLAAPFFCLLPIRKKARSMTVFIALHACAALAPVLAVRQLADGAAAMASVTAFVAVSTAYSCYARANRELMPRTKTDITCIIALNVVLAYISGQFGLERVPYFAGISLVILTCVMLYTHIDNLDARLLMLRGTGKHPVGDVLRENNRLIVLFVGIVAAIGFFTIFFPANAVSGAVLGVLLSLGLLIGRINQTMFPQAFENMSAPGFYEMAGPGEVFLDFERTPEDIPSTIWQMLGSVLNYSLLALLMMVVALFFTRGFYKGFRAKRRAHAADVDDASGADEVSDVTKSMLSDIRGLIPRPSSFAKHPIRRAYIRKVRWHIKHGKGQGLQIARSDTPDAIAGKIRSREDIDELTKAYEKVRYGRS